MPAPRMASGVAEAAAARAGAPRSCPWSPGRRPTGARRTPCPQRRRSGRPARSRSPAPSSDGSAPAGRAGGRRPGRRRVRSRRRRPPPSRPRRRDRHGRTGRPHGLLARRLRRPVTRAGGRDSSGPRRPARAAPRPGRPVDPLGLVEVVALAPPPGRQREQQDHEGRDALDPQPGRARSSTYVTDSVLRGRGTVNPCAHPSRVDPVSAVPSAVARQPGSAASASRSIPTQVWDGGAVASTWVTVAPGSVGTVTGGAGGSSSCTRTPGGTTRHSEAPDDGAHPVQSGRPVQPPLRAPGRPARPARRTRRRTPAGRGSGRGPRCPDSRVWTVLSSRRVRRHRRGDLGVAEPAALAGHQAVRDPEPSTLQDQRARPVDTLRGDLHERRDHVRFGRDQHVARPADQPAQAQAHRRHDSDQRDHHGGRLAPAEAVAAQPYPRAVGADGGGGHQPGAEDEGRGPRPQRDLGPQGRRHHDPTDAGEGDDQPGGGDHPGRRGRAPAVGAQQSRERDQHQRDRDPGRRDAGAAWVAPPPHARPAGAGPPGRPRAPPPPAAGPPCRAGRARSRGAAPAAGRPGSPAAASRRAATRARTPAARAARCRRRPAGRASRPAGRTRRPPRAAARPARRGHLATARPLPAHARRPTAPAAAPSAATAVPSRPDATAPGDRGQQGVRGAPRPRAPPGTPTTPASSR